MVLPKLSPVQSARATARGSLPEARREAVRVDGVRVAHGFAAVQCTLLLQELLANGHASSLRS